MNRGEYLWTVFLAVALLIATLFHAAAADEIAYKNYMPLMVTGCRVSPDPVSEPAPTPPAAPTPGPHTMGASC